MKLSNIKLAATLLSVTLLALPGCGGGSSPTPEAPAITISGVAATGAAFVDAVVSVIDRTGAVVGTSTPVGSDGVFSVTLTSNAQAPFVLVASRTNANGETQTLVSVVESTNQTTANVTPITNLIAARLSQSGDPAQLASELAAGTTQITPEAVADTVAEVQTILAPLLAVTGTASADPLKDTFSTNGTGYDLLLDAINISIIPASDNSSNIEITVKQQLEEGEQPTAISFSSATTEPPSLPTIDANKLPAEGLSVKITQFLGALTTCYAVPFEERVSGVTSGTVNAVVGSAANVQATACRQVFSASNPATFLNNGSVVGRDANNSGAFASLFRRGATGLTFSQGSYEFTRANGDIVISYKSRGSDGSENYDTFVLTDDGDGVLRLIGNQYRYGGKVSAYHQLRNFITLNQGTADYHSTGYDINIPNEQTGSGAKFNRVVVTTPNNSTLTLKPNGNASFLGLVKPGATPTVTGTSFVRLRSEYVNTANGLSHPRDIDTNLFFVGTDRTETELANAKAGGTWKFEYFLNADDPNTPTDDTIVPVVQYYKNRARALTIAELRTQGLAQLSPTLVTDIASGAVPVGNPNAGQIQFSANEAALIGTDNNGPGWSVASGQLPPTSITLFGSLSGMRFTDSLNVLSTARSATVPCSRQSDTDNHCHNNGNGSFGPGFAEGASLNGLHLFARDAGGREYANFYAMYNLNLAP